MISLTRQQKKLLDFLAYYIGEYGIAPSYDEMKAHMGLGSKSGVHHLIVALEERGHIRRLAFRSRAIEICAPQTAVNWPDESWPTSKLAALWIRATEILNARESQRSAT